MPLDAVGREQARALRGRLDGCAFARVLVSPLGRAAETCALAGYDDAEVCADLREWDYGDYEGLTTGEIRRRRPGWSLWEDGVPGGETLDQVAARADAVVDTVRRSDGDVLAFAHAHILRVVAARWLGLGGGGGALLVLEPASVSVLGWEHGAPVLRRWNDTGTSPV